MELLFQGAEASIYRDGDRILKIRRPKRYRHPLLDARLRIRRTRHEASLLAKCPVPAPKVQAIENDGTLVLSHVKGTVVRDLLDKQPELAAEIGALLGRLHDAHIIHADLTTSNMIWGPPLAILDFGLAYTSHRVEDKAVDLHLFRSALASSHHRVLERAWQAFLGRYAPKNRDEILARFRTAAARGRNK